MVTRMVLLSDEQYNSLKQTADLARENSQAGLLTQLRSDIVEKNLPIELPPNQQVPSVHLSGKTDSQNFHPPTSSVQPLLSKPDAPVEPHATSCVEKRSPANVDSYLKKHILEGNERLKKKKKKATNKKVGDKRRLKNKKVTPVWLPYGKSS